MSKISLIIWYGLAISLPYPSGEEGDNFLVQLISSCHFATHRGRGEGRHPVIPTHDPPPPRRGQSNFLPDAMQLWCCPLNPCAPLVSRALPGRPHQLCSSKHQLRTQNQLLQTRKCTDCTVKWRESSIGHCSWDTVRNISPQNRYRTVLEERYRILLKCSSIVTYFLHLQRSSKTS